VWISIEIGMIIGEEKVHLEIQRVTFIEEPPHSLNLNHRLCPNTSQVSINTTIFLAGIDFHCYSQLVLRPYGWSTAKTPDETALKIIGDGVSYEIQRNSGLKYTSQRAIDLYPATGGASDWFYMEGIWASYTIELRDTGKYGFILPASQIIPTGEEIFAAMRYFGITVLDTHP